MLILCRFSFQRRSPNQDLWIWRNGLWKRPCHASVPFEVGKGMVLCKGLRQKLSAWVSHVAWVTDFSDPRLFAEGLQIGLPRSHNSHQCSPFFFPALTVCQGLPAQELRTDPDSEMWFSFEYKLYRQLQNESYLLQKIVLFSLFSSIPSAVKRGQECDEANIVNGCKVFWDPWMEGLI